MVFHRLHEASQAADPHENAGLRYSALITCPTSHSSLLLEILQQPGIHAS